MRITRKALILIIAIIVSLLYGTIGVYLLKNQFQGINSWFDALYYTVVVYATLGGKMSPSTEFARFFEVTMVFVGVGCFATILSLIVAPYVEKKIRKVLVMLENFDNLSNHTIICGFTAITWQILLKYQQQKKDVVIILSDDTKVSLMEAFDVNYIVGDTTIKEILEMAGIEKASEIICGVEDDAQNILLAMMVTELKDAKNNNQLQTIAIIQNPDNKDRALKSGADNVILPAELAVDALSQIAH